MFEPAVRPALLVPSVVDPDTGGQTERRPQQVGNLPSRSSVEWFHEARGYEAGRVHDQRDDGHVLAAQLQAALQVERQVSLTQIDE